MSTRREFVESSFALAVMCCNQASLARSGGGVLSSRRSNPLVRAPNALEISRSTNEWSRI
jgi:hypothetical protein